MKKVLFVVTSDPRRSSRPAEAVRVAAGVGAWRKVEVNLYLRGPAVLALGEFTDELVDEDHFQRYLPIIREWGRPVLVERGTASLQALGDSTIPFEEVDETMFASHARLHDSVLRF